jgi:hypothetical protein
MLRDGELVEISQVIGGTQNSALSDPVVPEVVISSGSREEGELVVC